MTPILVPKLSMSGEPVRITTWLAGDGARVQRGEPVAELETDKSTVLVEAPETGVLNIVVEAGTDVDVDAVIARILGPESAGAKEVPPEPARPGPGDTPPTGETASSRGLRASPAARRLAAERGVDLDSIAGSGPGGRIVAVDLEGQRAQPTTSFRDAVVAGLSASWREIPHINIGGRIDAEGLSTARAASGKATVTDLLAFALARAVRHVPSLNGIVGKQGDASSVHLSLAVASDGGIVAPTIRNAESLTLDELTAERERLVTAARAGSLEKRDLGGGTITLSNLGRYPVDFFTPVIAGPQVCLVATGRLAREPVVVDDMIALRHRMWVNVAIDHRAADGEAGGRLLAALEQQLNVLGSRSGAKA